MVLDVVCNMQVDEKTAKWKSDYKAKTYYFCSPVCKQDFDKSPEKFIKPTQAAELMLSRQRRGTLDSEEARRQLTQRRFFFPDALCVLYRR